jgi:hypothetical protein
MANGSGERRIASWTESLVASAAPGRFLDFILGYLRRFALANFVQE